MSDSITSGPGSPGPEAFSSDAVFHVEPRPDAPEPVLFHVEPSPDTVEAHRDAAEPVVLHVEPPAVAELVFGDRLALAERYAAHLVGSGVERGLLGPREAPRIWERHILNCAVVAELLPDGARTVDIGSGAGLPGIPLALARPDLSVVAVAPQAHRVAWLREVVEDLDLPVTVERGRAEESGVRTRWEGADVVTARAVAPLARLAGWALPLLRPAGTLLALKGQSAETELARDAVAVRKLGGNEPRIVRCGNELVDPPSTVVVVERARGTGRRPGRPRRREERS